MRSARIVRLVCFEIFATDAYADERRFAPPTPLPPGKLTSPSKTGGRVPGIYVSATDVPWSQPSSVTVMRPSADVTEPPAALMAETFWPAVTFTMSMT